MLCWKENGQGARGSGKEMGDLGNKWGTWEINGGLGK